MHLLKGFKRDSLCFIDAFMHFIRHLAAYIGRVSFESRELEHGSQQVAGGQQLELANSKQIGRIVDRAADGTGSSSTAGGILGGGAIGRRCGSAAEPGIEADFAGTGAGGRIGASSYGAAGAGSTSTGAELWCGCVAW
ncbi:MAG: hypothetical protein ACYTGL_18645 [Planctomycetota bacterium]